MGSANTAINCRENVSQIMLLSSVALHFVPRQHSCLSSFEAGCGFTDEERRRDKIVITTAAKTINRMRAPILIVLVLLFNEDK